MQTVVIIGGKIIDGLGGDPVDKGMVIIEGDRISAVGSEKNLGIPKSAQVIDVAGHTVMPGIIDAHVHSTYRARDMRQHLLNTPSYNILRSTKILHETLACGVTTARDMGGADAGFREAIEQGLVDGPRLQICLVMISQTGGHGDQWLPAGMRIQKRSWLPDPVVDGADGMRKKVRELLMAGADFIKICTGGGITSVTDSWDEAQFTVEEIKAAVAEAARRHKPVAAHAEGLLPIKNALQGGVSSVEHGWFIDEECIDLMIAQNTWWVPTLALVPRSVERRVSDPAWSEQQMGEEEKKDNEIHAKMQDQVPLWREAVRRGVNIAMGTDQSHRLLVGENLIELKYMVDWLGMSPMQAIVAATGTAAVCVGRPDLGALEAGRLADLLVIDADPLEDISVLNQREHLRLIMQGGKCFKNLFN